MAHRVLILEDDESLRLVIAKALSRAGFEVRATASLDAALERLSRREVDLLIADVVLGRENFLDRLNEVMRVHPEIPIIVMSAQTTAKTAIEAAKAGVFEYLPKPFDLNVMVDVIQRALQLKGIASAQPPQAGFSGLVGRSPAMQDAFNALGRLARIHSPVLFTGPDGAGRAHAARVLVSEAGIIGPVIEAGPDRMRREGADLMARAAGGALILRRAESWDAMMQDWVHEALENPRSDIPRVLVTAHDDVSDYIRPSLLALMAVGRVRMPPLRERGQDRSLLFEHFLANAPTARKMDDSVRAYVDSQIWTGEVLELKRVVMRLSGQGARGPVNVAEIELIMKEFIQPDPDKDLSDAAIKYFSACAALDHDDIGVKAQLAVDRGLIEAALKASSGVRQEAAKALGLNRNTLSRRMATLNMGDDAS